MDAVASLHQRSYLTDSFIDRALQLHQSLVKAGSCSPRSSNFYQALSSGLSRIHSDLGLNLLHCIESVLTNEAKLDEEVEKLDQLGSRLKLTVQLSCLTLKMIHSQSLIKALNQLLLKVATGVSFDHGSSLLSAADMTHLMIFIFDSAACACDSLKESEPSVQVDIDTLMSTVLVTCQSLEDRGEKERTRKSVFKTTNGTDLHETRNLKAGLSRSKWSFIDSLLYSQRNPLSSDLCLQVIVQGLDALQSCSESSIISVLR